MELHEHMRIEQVKEIDAALQRLLQPYLDLGYKPEQLEINTTTDYDFKNGRASTKYTVKIKPLI